MNRLRPTPEKEHETVSQMLVDLLEFMIEVLGKEEIFDDIADRAKNKRN